MTVHTDKNKFDKQIRKPCVVDFYTTGCPNCAKLAEVFEEVSEEFENIAFYKVNLDEDLTLAERYGLRYVPTLMLFNGGELIAEHTGYLSAEELTAFIMREEAAK